MPGGGSQESSEGTIKISIGRIVHYRLTEKDAVAKGLPPDHVDAAVECSVRAAKGIISRVRETA
jgi:hypothetical protein